MVKREQNVQFYFLNLILKFCSQTFGDDCIYIYIFIYLQTYIQYICTSYETACVPYIIESISLHRFVCCFSPAHPTFAVGVLTASYRMIISSVLAGAKRISVCVVVEHSKSKYLSLQSLHQATSHSSQKISGFSFLQLRQQFSSLLSSLTSCRVMSLTPAYLDFKHLQHQQVPHCSQQNLGFFV